MTLVSLAALAVVGGLWWILQRITKRRQEIDSPDLCDRFRVIWAISNDTIRERKGA